MVAGDKAQGPAASAHRRPPLKTIAEICGLGVPTVSRAMNDSSEISEATKARIRQIAAEIGYVPDRAGLLLRTGRTHVISLAFVINRDDQMGRLIPAIAGALLSTRFQIGIAPALSHEASLCSIRQVVEDRMADAFIFNETPVDDTRVEYLLERKFPFATHGRNTLAHLHADYDFDDGAFARKAAGLLHRRGRRHLALLGPSPLRTYGRDTVLAASHEASLVGMGFQEIEGAHSSDPLPVLRAAARRHVAKHPHCDAYICSSGPAAMATLAALKEAGRVIGRDVDMVAKGSPTFLNMLCPEIVAIEEDVARAADFLTKAVLHAFQATGEPPLQEVEQPDFGAYLSQVI